MTTVARQTARRNEGGRYTARSTWYDAIAQEHIARIEAMEAQATVATLAKVVGDAVTALPEAASRITKAATLVQAKDVWPMTDGTFIVGSQSDTDKAYLVRRGPWRCECQAAQHQAGPSQILRGIPAFRPGGDRRLAPTRANSFFLHRSQITRYTFSTFSCSEADAKVSREATSTVGHTGSHACESFGREQERGLIAPESPSFRAESMSSKHQLAAMLTVKMGQAYQPTYH